MRLAPAIAVFLMYLFSFLVNLFAQFRRDDSLKALLARCDRLLFLSGCLGVFSIYFYNAGLAECILSFMTLAAFTAMLVGMLSYQRLSERKRSILAMVYLAMVWVWLCYVLVDFIVLSNTK